MAVTQTLTLTEVAGSVSNTANTSKVRILWQSTQTGESWNGYTKTAKYYVSINGGAETEYSVSYTLPQSATKTIVDTTLTVTHKSDGTGTVKVRTWMDTGISAGVVEKSRSLTLTTIPRASSIDSLTCATRYFDGTMTYKYTPKSASYYNRCNISLNINGAYTAVKTINLGQQTASQKTATVTLSESELSTIYNKLPSTTQGVLRFTFRTYSDSGYSTQIGSEGYKELTLYIPNISDTQPTATMTLSPVSSLSSPFSSLYIKGRSKVDANFTNVEGKYGAAIVSYTLNALGKSYGSPYTSEYLTTEGTITVTGTLTDSRGYSRTYSQDITVIPYSNPRIIPTSADDEIVCSRCDENGNILDNGTYLRIKAKRTYSKVISNGEQKNFCQIRYRYKAEGGSYSSWITILASNSASDEVDTGALLNGSLQLTSSYVVQVGVIDTLEESDYTTINIPTDKVYMHKAGSKNSVGLGKYAERDNAVDSEWDVYMNSHRITELPMPIGDTDAVPKAYVDAADIKISKSLNATGWYKIGTLSGEMCAVATLVVGGIFVNNQASPSMVDIATQYNNARAFLRLPSLADSQISKIGVAKESTKVYGVYAYYNNTNENPVSINIHTHMGAFVSADFAVSSVSDSDMLAVVTLKQ